MSAKTPARTGAVTAIGLDEQLAQLLASKGSDYQRARRAMRRANAADAVPVLIRALDKAQNRSEFSRVSGLLLLFGGDEAALALARQAQAQRRWARLAIRALSRCNHADVVPTLVTLLEDGRRKQREAAADALGRLKPAVAVEPIALIAANRDDPLHAHAYAALLAMGRPEQIVRLTLAATTMTVDDRVRALRALGVYRYRWPYPTFRVERCLDREARNAASPLQTVARQALDLLRAPTVLLRPSMHRDDSTLLRAVLQNESVDTGDLVRAADAPDDDRLDGDDGLDEGDTLEDEIGVNRSWWWRCIIWIRRR